MEMQKETGRVQTIQEQIEKILEEKVRPSLLAHGGNLTLLSFQDGIARIRFTGACSGCPSADLTLEMLVREEVTKALPQVKDVAMEQSVSEEMLNLAHKILRHEEIL